MTDKFKSKKGNFEILISDSRPVIVDFHALWCGPCRVQSPMLKDVADELGDRVRVIMIDVDQNNNLASKYQIKSVPTLIIFIHGKPVLRQSGVITKAALLSVLKQNM